MKPIKIQAVIGANFGDCGKGLITDYYAHKFNKKGLKTIVIRYNGGAQAGHTVVTPEGTRHSFGHIGAGTFAGVPTHLSRFFVCNPLLFNKELDNLIVKTKKDFKNEISASPECLVTTPYDMYCNQVLETRRGDKRHGSCGVGFGATLERHEDRPDLDIQIKDLPEIEGKLARIKVYYEQRLDIPIANVSVNILEAFRYCVERFQLWVKINNDDSVLDSYEAVIFEGAQGLQLDQDYGEYPYVTWSNTGLKNIHALLNTNIPVDVTYVTRTYVTRHGAGPLPYEDLNLSFEDKTNVTNRWQGKLRFAPLNIISMAKAIRHDMYYHANSSISLAMTCVDQLPNSTLSYKDKEYITYKEYDNTIYSYEPVSFCKRLLSKLDLSETPASPILISRGPTRETIEEEL